jgi:hypothetical protein
MRRRIFAAVAAVVLLGVVLLPLIPAVQGRARQLWYTWTSPRVVPVFSHGQYQGSYVDGNWESYRQELERFPIHERYDQTMKDLHDRAQKDCQGQNFDPCLADQKKALAAVQAMKDLDCGVLEQKKRCEAEARNAAILSASVADVENARRQSQRNGALVRADNYCVQVAIQYGADASKGLCDAAMDQAVGQVSGKPSAYDLCHAGSEAACEIAVGHMSVSDPRYDEVWTRIHRAYEFR